MIFGSLVALYVFYAPAKGNGVILLLTRDMEVRIGHTVEHFALKKEQTQQLFATINAPT